MTASEISIELARLATEAALERGAIDPVAIDVSERVFLTDIFLVLSADSDRGVRAVADAVDEAMLKAGHKRLRREGHDQARWILQDYDHLVIHVFLQEDRDFYDLERLWADGPRVDLQLPEAATQD
ncbi:ribosome silencing factor [Boudabousia liubingyangii]|uniref:ribosome silencing factor n=1 Tax=Boudabousia liubingyangii TaxID=1921764 RepID=UPI00093F0110|nr:ribosome silencing factor [Boudabousia liubingyangii]OKL47764.1 ribosome silencing factor [Boudabousia liubingyangii]